MNHSKLATTITQYSVGWKPTDDPYAPFETGDLLVDNFLHHMKKDHGIRAELAKGFKFIHQLEIVDDAKASWFLLKHG